MSFRSGLAAVLLTVGVAPAQSPIPAGKLVLSQTHEPAVGTHEPSQVPPAGGPVVSAPTTTGPVAGGPVSGGPTTGCATTPVCPTAKCSACVFYKQCILTPATVVPPLGSAVRAANDAQRVNALAEYFVVYREDFDAGEATVNPSGERHLDGIARRLRQAPVPVRVEPTGDPLLDEKRRVAVIEALGRHGVPFEEASARVIFGTTRAEGLRYSDIERVYGRFQNSGGFGGFGGGFGSLGGGFGGGFGFYP